MVSMAGIPGAVKPAAQIETDDTSDARRRQNAQRVLDRAWTGEVLTATDLMERLPGTRATTLAVCGDLVDRGWLSELEPGRSGASGRPTRRFQLRPESVLAIGIDAGLHAMATTAIDARGEHVQTFAQTLDADDDAASRRDVVLTHLRAVSDQLGAAGVVAACVGVPAPVASNGRSPQDPLGFWGRMNPDLKDALAEAGVLGCVENDANLAAIAEGEAGAAVGVDSYATLLTGERLGAGLVVDGRPLRGRNGMAGELGVLDFVEGVGSSRGLGALAADLAQLATVAGGPPLGPDGHPVSDARGVLAAAAAGDSAAERIVDALADRLARISAVLAGSTGVGLIVLAGGVADSAEILLERTRPRLARIAVGDPPDLAASTLGARGVAEGAAHRALQLVRERALSLRPTVGAAD